MADRPKRIQRKRTKGWRMPPNTVYVGRPSRWGNPWPHERVQYRIWSAVDFSGITGAGGDGLWSAIFLNHRPERRASTEILNASVSALAIVAAVTMFRALIDHFRRIDPDAFERWIEPLRGKNLACWCGLDQPCHADVLLTVANA